MLYFFSALRYATVDFSVQDESIMTTNIELPSDPSPFIIYDMNGNIINKLTKDIVYEDIDPNLYCQKAFYKVDGSLYALDGNANKVYSTSHSLGAARGIFIQHISLTIN